MNERIRELRKALSLTQKEFAEKIGLGQTAVSHLEQSGSNITEQTIKTICMQFSVNEDWLRTGIGNMIQEPDRKQHEFFELFNQFSPILQDYLIQTARFLLEAQNKLFSEKSDNH